MSNEDYYQRLGVAKTADKKQIKDAYRELAFKYHPDRNEKDAEAVEKMKAINEAYAVLSDPAKKREYDAMQIQYGQTAHTQFRQSYSDQDIFNGSDVHHVFEEMAKSFGVRGFDEIFKEAYGRRYQRFEFKGGRMRGTGFGGRGFEGAFRQGGSPMAMLKQIIKMAQRVSARVDSVQGQVRGADIHDIIRITPAHARDGGPYAYYLRKLSKRLVVKVPPGIQEGQRIRLAGQGEPGRSGGTAGDLFLKVQFQKSALQRIKAFITDMKNSG